MRKTKEVLRLHFEAGLSERQIAKICVLGKGTVRRFLKRAEAAGLSWPLPPSLDDAALEKQLFPPPPPPSAGQRPQPDYATIHKELKGPNVTLQLLWEEYKQAHPDGYSYSRFSELYGAWSRRLDLRGRYRFPTSSGFGPFFNAHSQQLAMGNAASLYLVYRPHWNRQVVVSASPGAEGLPRWIYRVVPAASETIP
jgi:hypothetical protein